MNQLVSVIIPVYNREEFIIESLSSAVSQTYTNIEVIVVDNHSSDNTWFLLESFASRDKRVKIFRNSVNLGPVNNWFKAISYASGEFIKIIWSDDFIEQSFISKAMSVFAEDTAFVMSGVRNFNANGFQRWSTFQNLGELSSEEYLSDLLIYNRFKFPVSPGCAIFRKQDIVNYVPKNINNVLNLDFTRNGAGIDLLFFLTSTIGRTKVRMINENLSHFRGHSDSITVLESSTLGIHYQLAKQYFIELYALNYLDEFKTANWIKSVFDSDLRRMNDYVNGNYVFSTKLLIFFLTELYNFIVIKVKNILKKYTKFHLLFSR